MKTRKTGALPRMLAGLGVLLLFSAVVALLGECIWRGSIHEGVLWAGSYRMFYGRQVLFVLLMALLVLALSRRAGLSCGISAGVLTVFALVNKFKIYLREEPFKFSDIYQISEGFSAGIRYQLPMDRFTWLLIALVVLTVLLMCGIHLSRQKWRWRLAQAALAAGLMAVLGISGMEAYSNTAAFSQIELYQKNGLFGGFTCTLPRKIREPDDYSKETVDRMLSSGPVPRKAEEAPDIFFFMCESLYDICRDPDITVSEDPLSNLRRLQAEGWQGNLLVSQYGGGTANTEYEILTGYRAIDIEGTAYVIENSMRQGMDSLPSLLERYGYRTTAIHPGPPMFYSRRTAYQKLGFDRSLFTEDLTHAPVEFEGGVPSDHWLFGEILELWKQDRGNAPNFYYVVTHQNHGGFSSLQVEQQISAEGGTNPQEMNIYANLIHVTDRELPALFDAFRDSDRPVLVVLFGDHAPSGIGIEYGDSLEKQYFKYTTPLLVWSNFGYEMPEKDRTEIATYRLGAIILKALGYGADPYLNSLSDQPDLFFQPGLVARKGTLVQEPETWQEENGRLWMLHYDRLYGQRYASPVSP